MSQLTTLLQLTHMRGLETSVGDNTNGDVTSTWTGKGLDPKNGWAVLSPKDLGAQKGSDRVTETSGWQMPGPQTISCDKHSEGEGEVSFFSAKRWDRRNRAHLTDSATPCHDTQVVGSYRVSNGVSNPLPLTGLAAKSEDYTTAPQHLHSLCSYLFTKFQNCFKRFQHDHSG